MNLSRIYRVSIIAFLILFCNALTSQNKLSDSALVLLGDAKHDTSKCNILSALIDKQPTPDLWAPFNEEIERICDRNLYRKQLSSEEKLFYKKALALATNNKGYLAQVKGNYAEASDMYLRTLKLQDEILSLPMDPELTEEDQSYVIDQLKRLL